MGSRFFYHSIDNCKLKPIVRGLRAARVILTSRSDARLLCKRIFGTDRVQRDEEDAGRFETVSGIVPGGPKSRALSSGRTSLKKRGTKRRACIALHGAVVTSGRRASLAQPGRGGASPKVTTPLRKGGESPPIFSSSFRAA